MRDGRRRGSSAVLAAGTAVYALVHVAVWGGLTVYASGDHFEQSGQLSVMGEDPNFVFRSWRLIDLLVDRTFGLVAWQPAWLLLTRRSARSPRRIGSRSAERLSRSLRRLARRHLSRTDHARLLVAPPAGRRGAATGGADHPVLARPIRPNRGASRPSSGPQVFTYGCCWSTATPVK